jgi:hypothetical protein
MTIGAVLNWDDHLSPPELFHIGHPIPLSGQRQPGCGTYVISADL